MARTRRQSTTRSSSSSHASSPAHSGLGNAFAGTVAGQSDAFTDVRTGRIHLGSSFKGESRSQALAYEQTNRANASRFLDINKAAHTGEIGNAGAFAEAMIAGERPAVATAHGSAGARAPAHQFRVGNKPAMQHYKSLYGEARKGNTVAPSFLGWVKDKASKAWEGTKNAASSAWKSTKNFYKENKAAIHTALDVVGMIPVVGEVADLANAGLYLADGDYANAALSGASAIPGLGQLAAGTKLAKKAASGAKALKTVKGVDKVVSGASTMTKAVKNSKAAKKLGNATEAVNKMKSAAFKKVADSPVGKAAFNQAEKVGGAYKVAKDKVADVVSKAVPAKYRGKLLGEGAGEKYFRGMSTDEYSLLSKNNKLPTKAEKDLFSPPAPGKKGAGAETSISPTKEFSEGYGDNLVQFNMKPGTTNDLASVGVRDQSKLVKKTYPDMPTSQKGWTHNNAQFKAERKHGLKKNPQQINVNLGQGPGLDTFNGNINSFVDVANPGSYRQVGPRGGALGPYVDGTLNRTAVKAGTRIARPDQEPQ